MKVRLYIILHPSCFILHLRARSQEARRRAANPSNVGSTPTARSSGRKTAGLTAAQYAALVYVRGRVWHGDHETVVLDVWRGVAMNTEREAPFATHVTFLD